MSLFRILDEECMIKGTCESFINKLNNNLQQNTHFKKPENFSQTSFVIAHYAGDVEYETDSFLEKNRDTVNDIIG